VAYKFKFVGLRSGLASSSLLQTDSSVFFAVGATAAAYGANAFGGPKVGTTGVSVYTRKVKLYVKKDC
jgi:hypothetical protein